MSRFCPGCSHYPLVECKRNSMYEECTSCDSVFYICWIPDDEVVKK